MFWYSVLKDLTHFMAEGCLQSVVTAEVNTMLRTESGGMSTARAQSGCPERELKGEHHTALTSAFDFVIHNSAGDPITEGTNRKRASGRRAWALCRQVGRVPWRQASFSATVGYFPSLAKSLGKADDLPEKCLILLKDGFASGFRSIWLLGHEPETSFNF